MLVRLDDCSEFPTVPKASAATAIYLLGEFQSKNRPDLNRKRTTHLPIYRMTRFLILFEGRSGSTYLVEALDSHPDIRAGKELLGSVKTKGRTWSEAQLEFLNEYYFGSDVDQYRAVGFKTKRKDILRKQELAQWLRDNQVKIILLRRRNRVKRMVSVMNGLRLKEETGDWNLYRDKDQRGAIEIDVERFDQWLKRDEERLQLLVDYASSLELPTLSICYEELLTSADTIIERICEFLGVAYRTLEGDCLKNTSDDLSEAVVNFKELKNHFSGTLYEDMFDERLVQVE